MAVSGRARLQKEEEIGLDPCARRSTGASRRFSIEDEGRAFDYRTHFQRDRDRIVYSRAFRRLRQKAVVGILPAYEDHRRNRLTHTLEVSQLARTVARALALNEDLTEAVALGHDLGQPPFGDGGCRALDDLLGGRMDGHGGPGLGDLGGFSRAGQSLRVVDLLEKRYDHPGLNLTDAVREGILRSGPVAGEAPEGTRLDRPADLEAQVVTLADRLASALHDLDDALQAGTVDLAAVERLVGVQELKKKIGRAYPGRAGKFVKANAIHRGLTHLLVTAAIVASRRSLERFVERHGIEDHDGYLTVRERGEGGGLIRLPASARRIVEDLEGFLEGRVRRSWASDQVERQGRRVLLGLFAAAFVDPRLLPDHVLLRYKEVAGARFLRDLPRQAVASEVRRRYRKDPRFVRVLADHLAAMTDAYAVEEFGRLMQTGAVPIPSVEQLRREEEESG